MAIDSYDAQIESLEDQLYDCEHNAPSVYTSCYSCDQDRYIHPSPAIGSDGTIYVGSWDFNLYAINADGSLKLEYGAGNSISYSSPAIGSDGTIYVGSIDGYLYSFESSSRWTNTSYQISMKAYENSNWPRFGQNSYNLHTTISITTTKKSLPMAQIMKILGLSLKE
ncbi:MAG: PQQ-like beta-propeller repeat protein [Candidatus Methanofastidiosa archaeon]|nr:PQQ-like beta-propeller repeat protein [Candidatus Methanofastidiosa archaeon]